MLSKWHEAAPRERVANLEFRRALWRRCGRDKAARALVLEACRLDLLFYVSAFCWTFDPRTEEKFLPFVPWPVQEKAFLAILECIKVGRDLVIEKSRDMGASWMSLLAMEWMWHFHPGNSFLMISRKEDLVDAPGDPDSLFWKIDFIHKHLPGWLRPCTDRRKLHFENEENGSTIDGESTTAAAGVGGRRTAMFIDEFSRIEDGYALLAGTADTTRCRIFNFTPFGTSNAAYKLARRGDVRKLRLHWTDHPGKARGLYRWDEKKNQIEVLDKGYEFEPDFQFVLDGKVRSPWYDGECARRANDREVAQMLDIDYQGSAYQFFDRSLIMALQAEYAIPAYWEGDIAFDSDTGRPVELVRAEGGPLKLWTQLDTHGRPPVAPYTMGADLAVGTGATNSVLSILNCKTGEKVGEYATPYLRPEAMALRATALAWWFKDERGEGCAFIWEMQGPGVVFGKRVIELGYRNVYYRTREHSLQKTVSDSPGWVPTPENKRVVIEEYRTALATRQFLNRSHEALEECLQFVHTASGQIEHAEELGGDDPSGARVNHGDRVIPDALSWKLARDRYGMNRKKLGLAPDEVRPGSLAWRRQLAYDEQRASAW